MSEAPFFWIDHRLFSGALEAPLAEITPFGGPSSERLPAFVALIHLPGADKPKGGAEADVRRQCEESVQRWLNRAYA